MTDRSANIRVNVTGNAAASLKRIETAVRATESSTKPAAAAFKKAENAVKGLGSSVSRAASSFSRAGSATARLGTQTGRLKANVSAAASSTNQLATANARVTAAVVTQTIAVNNEAKAYKRLEDAARKANRATGGGGAPPRQPPGARGGINARLGQMNNRLDARFGNIPILRNFTNVTGMAEGAIGGVTSVVSGVMSAAAIAAAAATAAFATGMVAAVSEASQLETAMSRVRAATAGSRVEMRALTAAAQQLGAATQYSAAEVAAVQENFAKAGFSVQQIVAATPSTLNFAAATGSDTGFASGMLAQTVRAMNFQAEQSGMLADSLVIGAQASNVDVSDLSEAMKYAAPIFSSMSGGNQTRSFQDMIALSGILGDQGIRGSQAGTALRSGYSRLASPNSRTAGELSRLGVSTTGADGSMRRLPEILVSLRDSLEGQTDQQRSAAMTNIFGLESAGAFTAILNADPSRFGELVRALEESGGAAERTARIMQDNLGGDLEQLGGAFGGLGVTIGDQLLPHVRTMAESLTDLVGPLDRALQSSGLAHSAFGTLGGAVDGLVESMLSNVERLIPTIAQFMNLRDPGSGDRFTRDFRDQMTSSRIERATSMGERARDQIRNEESRNVQSLQNVGERASRASGATGAAVVQDFRDRLRVGGHEELASDPRVAAVLARVGGRGTIGARDRRGIRAELEGALNPTVEERVAGVHAGARAAEAPIDAAVRTARQRVVVAENAGRTGQVEGGDSIAMQQATLAQLATYLQQIAANTGTTAATAPTLNRIATNTANAPTGSPEAVPP